MGITYVSSGMTYSGHQDVGAGEVYVLSGGFAEADGFTNVGAELVVGAGGSAGGSGANADSFSFGGEEIIGGGALVGIHRIAAGSAFYDVLNSGGLQYVYGYADETQIDGGVEFVTTSSGTAGIAVGSASSTIVNANGEEIVSGGVSYGAQINKYGLEIVSSGEDFESYIADYGAEKIYASGTAMQTNVQGGIQYLSGGKTYGVLVDNQGEQIIVSGEAFATLIVGGGQYVKSGGIVSGTQLAQGGQYLSSGSIAYATQLNGTDALEYIYGGGASAGIAIGTSIAAGIQDDYGIASGTIITAGAQDIYYGGIADNTVVYAAGVQSVGTSGFASATVLSGGSETILFEGEAIATNASGGSVITVTSVGIAANAVLHSGAVMSADGWAMSTVVGASAQLAVYSGGSATSSNIHSGGLEIVFSGGIATGTMVSSGATLVVLPGAAVTGTAAPTGAHVISTGIVAISAIGANGFLSASLTSTISGTGAPVSLDLETVYVLSGGAATNIAAAGTDVFIYAGGKTTSATLSSASNSSGTEVFASGFISAGGIASATLIEGQANLTISSGGSAIGTVISFGNQYVSSGGAASKTIIKPGGQEIIYGGGTDSGTNFLNGADQVIVGGTVYAASGTGALQLIYIGGSAIGDQFSGTAGAGSRVNVYFGGTASATSLTGSAVVSVFGGGLAAGTVIHSGGVEYVGFEGIASGATVGSAGEIVVQYGGTAANVVVNAQGRAVISGLVSGTVLSGGTLSLASGGMLSGGFEFAGTGGELVISGAALPSTVISGFVAGDTIDLAGITYSAGATATVKSAGIVTISNGSSSYNLHIAGATVGSTAYHFSSGSLLTTSITPNSLRTNGKAAMEFLTPAIRPADAPMPRELFMAPRETAAMAGPAGAAPDSVTLAPVQKLSLMPWHGAVNLPISSHGNF